LSFENNDVPSIAYPAVTYAKPLVEGLCARRDLCLSPMTPTDVLAALPGKQHACVLVPPGALLHHGPYRILPGVGVSSEAATGSELLVAPDSLDQIQEIVVHPNATHLVDLIRILYLLRGFPVPTFSTEGTLSGAATLLSGDEGRGRQSEAGHDLGTLWRESTDLPFVLGVWACSVGAPYRMLRTALGESSRGAIDSVKETEEKARLLHYSVLSRESDSLRELHALAVRFNLCATTEEAIVFC
jgi:predicted solute-binding protein